MRSTKSSFKIFRLKKSKGNWRMIIVGLDMGLRKDNLKSLIKIKENSIGKSKD